MKIISAFVDNRTGKRYAPGDEQQIKPALTAEQIARLKKAGCLAEGNEKAPPAPSFDKMASADLRALAELHKITLAEGVTDEQIVAALKAANVKPV